MSDQFDKFATRSANRFDDSACRYEEVDISAADYEPDEPFRGINTATAGTIEIVGFDDVQATVQLTQGTNAVAGKKLVSADSVVTSVTVLR